MGVDRIPADFGSRLRAARERRGVSLRQIANATKISIAALEALERNDISRLPGGIFSRAFVRAYALEVGLDPEATIQDFVAQFPHDSVTAGHPPSDPIEDHEAIESDRRMATTFLWLLAASIPIAGAVLYFGTAERRGARSAAAAPPPSVPGIEERIARAREAAPTSGSTAAPAATTPVPAMDRRDAERRRAEPAAEPRAAEPRPAETKPPVTAEKPAAAAPAAADVLTIELSVRRPVFVSATVDGQKAIEQLLPAGDRRTLEVRREMTITAGDGSAFTMTLNGAPARALGKAGELVSARVNLTNFKEYLQTR